MKRVTIALELSSEFVNMLNIAVQMDGTRDKIEAGKQITSVDQLALTVLAEARGGTVEQVEATLTHDWCDGIRVLSDQRKVVEVTS